MGIISRMLSGKKGRSEATQDSGRPRPEGLPVGMNREAPVLTITNDAKDKIRTVLQTQTPPVQALRVSASGWGKYSMNLEPDARPGLDDTVLDYDGFQVFIDPQSFPMVDGATVDWVETFGGGGFQFTQPNSPGRIEPKPVPEGPEGEVWRRIQDVLEDQINPAVASHGGRVDLIEFKDSTAFVLMSGGCQGCAMSKMTLKNGVETVLKSEVPEVDEVLDVTDHAGGRNPYYTAGAA